MGSTRFPGKMLALFNGEPILSWVLSRCLRATEVDRVVLATTASTLDEPLVALAEERGVAVFRGAEDDVLDRFVGAAREHGAAVVVRVCADNPLVDPAAIDRAVAHFRKSGADYVYNHVPRGVSEYPDGLGVEVVGAETLRGILSLAPSAGHREHVTSYIWDYAERYAIEAAPCPPAWSPGVAGMRLDVDEAEDLAFLNDVFDGLPMDAGPETIIGTWRARHGLEGPPDQRAPATG